MSATTIPSTHTFNVQGSLYDQDGKPFNKQRFHVYDTKQNFLTFGKTGQDGRFYVKINTPSTREETVSLTFRTCHDNKLVDQHPVLGKDPFLCKALSFLKNRVETSESFEIHLPGKSEKNVGHIHMRKPLESEEVPLSYLIDLATAAVPAKAKGILEKIREKIDLFSTHDISDVLKTFNISPTLLIPENAWKLLTNGICPLHFKETNECYIDGVMQTPFLATSAKIRNPSHKQGDFSSENQIKASKPVHTVLSEEVSERNAQTRSFLGNIIHNLEASFKSIWNFISARIRTIRNTGSNFLVLIGVRSTERDKSIDSTHTKTTAYKAGVESKEIQSPLLSTSTEIKNSSSENQVKTHENSPVNNVVSSEPFASHHYLVGEINWDRYEFDKLKSLPNLQIIFEKQADGSDPVLQEIRVQFRETLEPSSKGSDKTPVKVYKPDDEDFEVGLRAALSAAHVYGQTVHHLGIGHVFGSQVAGPAHDYLQGHLLGKLLLPHTQYIRKISNDLGKTAIFGEEGVLNVSALSVGGIAHLIADTLGGLDPLSYSPRSAINANHVSAKRQLLHYGLLQEAVHEYFDKNWEEMAKDWAPVHAFFHTLFKRSPTYQPPAEAAWRDTNEMPKDLEGLPERKEHKGEIRSFRPIAANPTGPIEGDRENIEKYVVFFLNLVTEWHSARHTSQYIETEYTPHIMDPNFAPITLENYGAGEYGGMSMKDIIKVLVIIDLFRHFPIEDYPLLDEKRVVPEITDRVKKAASEYAKLGLPIKFVSRTVEI